MANSSQLDQAYHFIMGRFADQDGATEVRLTHEMLPSENACDLHRQGWSSSLVCLNALIREGT